MKPVFHIGTGWFFHCAAQNATIGPFRTEGAAHEANVQQHSWLYVKTPLNAPEEVDLPYIDVLQ